MSQTTTIYNPPTTVSVRVQGKATEDDLFKEFAIFLIPSNGGHVAAVFRGRDKLKWLFAPKYGCQPLYATEDLENVYLL